MLNWVTHNWTDILKYGLVIGWFGGVVIPYAIGRIIAVNRAPTCGYPGCKEIVYIDPYLGHYSIACRKHYPWAKRQYAKRRKQSSTRHRA